MYIAIEHEEDTKLINDIGDVADTPEHAWFEVSRVFYAPATVIYKLVPVFKVVEGTRKLIPVKE